MNEMSSHFWNTLTLNSSGSHSIQTLLLLYFPPTAREFNWRIMEHKPREGMWLVTILFGSLLVWEQGREWKTASGSFFLYLHGGVGRGRTRWIISSIPLPIPQAAAFISPSGEDHTHCFQAKTPSFFPVPQLRPKPGPLNCSALLKIVLTLIHRSFKSSDCHLWQQRDSENL